MDIVLLVLALALAGACAGIWLWLQARRLAARLRRRNTRLQAVVEGRTQALSHALTAAEAENRRLAAEDRTKGELLRALGREMRTPLTTVMGFTQLLQANLDADPLTGRQAQALRQIEAAGAVLLALIEEADDFVASGDAGAPAVCRVDLRLALRQVCDGLEPQAREAGVSLACPPADCGLCVAADPAQVRHVLGRLVANAIRHSPHGAAVRMEMERTDSQVIVVIHDAGAAAPVDDPDRPFRPLDGLDARGGTSLGVASAQRLAERMGGAVTTARGAGCGAVFSLALPVAGPLAPAAPAEAVVLYIEDNPANIALMRQAAVGLGLTLHAAMTGAEGLELARALRPDVILLDIGLPDMDGYAVKGRLDADPATRDLPVLALTAAVSPQDRTRCRVAGFDAYLAKPLDLTALADALNTVLSRDASRAGLDAGGRQRA